MICITKIETVNVDRDVVEIALAEDPKYYATVCDSDPVRAVEVKTEMVRGITFRNSRGEDVCIGLAKEVQQALGLPFEAFENLSKSLEYYRGSTAKLYKLVDSLQEELEGCESILAQAQTLGFWDHIKLAFKKLK